MGQFIPRISIVFLVELFAYFFLNLYKSSLAEIKYYQNEMTNIEAQYTALLVALEKDDDQLKADILIQMAKTERNFVLSKGQTTVDLQQRTVDNETMNQFAQWFQKLVPGSTKPPGGGG